MKMFKHFWKQCAGDSNVINFSDFCILFDNQPFTGKRATTAGYSSRRSGMTGGYSFKTTSSKRSAGKWDLEVINNVRKTLRAASKST